MHKIFLTGAGILLAFSYASSVHAASSSLFFTPATGIFPIGEPFTVDVRIDTGGVAIGTVDASVTFDQNDLEYVSVSDSGSVMTRLLVDGSTKPGTIDLSGFVERSAEPYNGTDGVLAHITFMPKRNVATAVRFSRGAATPQLTLQASVATLANVLGTLRAATYTLVPKETIPPATVAGAYTDSGDAFTITPLPVPNNDEWFGTTSVKLSYEIPQGVTEMRTGISKDPNAQPDTPYPLPVNSVSFNHLEEGTNYFLLQFKYGETWGSVIRHALQVDLTPPGYIVIKEAERTDPSDPRVSFEIEAGDTLSGVSSYEVGVDGGETQPWDGNGRYSPEDLKAGEHTLTVIAYDHAGNHLSQDQVFLVKSLDPPALTYAPDRVLTGDSIIVKGTTYSNATVTVFTSFNDGEASQRSIQSDDAGAFTATISDGVRAGKYTVWFQVTDDRGATSPMSVKRSIEVSQPYIMLFGSVAVTYLSIIVPLLALIILLALILWLGYTYVRGYRTRVRRETHEAYAAVRGEFEALRDDLRTQIGMLERANQSRELTREEMRIFTELSKKLDYIERHIETEISDISEQQEPDTSPHASERVRTPDASAVASTTHQNHTVRIERR